MEKKGNIFFQTYAFFVIRTNRSRTPKYEFSLVTLRQNRNRGLQRGKANALTYCTTKSPSLSNYHRTCPTAVTFSLPHRSKSELLSKAIHLSAGSGILQNKMTGAFPEYGCNTSDLPSGFLHLKTRLLFHSYSIMSYQIQKHLVRGENLSGISFIIKFRFILTTKQRPLLKQLYF